MRRRRAARGRSVTHSGPIVFVRWLADLVDRFRRERTPGLFGEFRLTLVERNRGWRGLNFRDYGPTGDSNRRLRYRLSRDARGNKALPRRRDGRCGHARRIMDLRGIHAN